MHAAARPIQVETQRFLDHLAVERGLSGHTVRAYRRDLHRYATFAQSRGVTTVEGLDERIVRSFAASLSASTHGDDQRPYRATSVARTLSAVRSFHRFLIREGVLQHDAAAGLR